MGGLERCLGSELRYPYMLEFKSQTFQLLRDTDVLVLTHNQNGDCAFYCRVDEDDPVVYHIGYSEDPGAALYELATEDQGRLSSWLIDLVEDAIAASGRGNAGCRDMTHPVQRLERRAADWYYSVGSLDHVEMILGEG